MIQSLCDFYPGVKKFGTPLHIPLFGAINVPSTIASTSPALGALPTGANINATELCRWYPSTAHVLKDDGTIGKIVAVNFSFSGTWYYTGGTTPKYSFAVVKNGAVAGVTVPGSNILAYSTPVNSPATGVQFATVGQLFDCRIASVGVPFIKITDYISLYLIGAFDGVTNPFGGAAGSASTFTAMDFQASANVLTSIAGLRA